MAQYSMNAYDADIYIPGFKGLMPYGDQMGTDLRYSPDCMNVESVGGDLRPIGLYVPEDNISTLGDWPSGDIATIMVFKARSGDSSWTECAIAANGKIYKGQFTDGTIWSTITPSSSTLFQSNKWSWTVYEETTNGNLHTVLLISNTQDGMYKISGGSATKITGAPKNFAFIERYGERIWGCGATDAPDTIYYSASFSYSDWSINTTSPADGGGEIREPTWDFDNIVALKSFGDNLIAFTRKRLWKITGTDISSIYIQEQYGNGTAYPESIAVFNNRLYMFRDFDGIVVYDGNSTYPIPGQSPYSKYSLTPSVTNAVKGIIVRDRYIVSITKWIPQPPPGRAIPSRICVIYNINENTISLADSPEVISLSAAMDYGYALLQQPNKDLYVNQIGHDSWEGQNNPGYATKWVTPWITLGRKDIQKGGFELYFNPELSSDATDPVTFKFTIQTEKKSKVKEYTVMPLTAEEKNAGKQYKQKRIHFGGAGRRFRLIIETEEGATTPWRLIGGIHIIAEIDKD